MEIKTIHPKFDVAFGQEAIVLRDSAVLILDDKKYVTVHSMYYILDIETQNYTKRKGEGRGLYTVPQ